MPLFTIATQKQSLNNKLSIYQRIVCLLSLFTIALFTIRVTTVVHFAVGEEEAENADLLNRYMETLKTFERVTMKHGILQNPADWNGEDWEMDNVDMNDNGEYQMRFSVCAGANEGMFVHFPAPVDTCPCKSAPPGKELYAFITNVPSLAAGCRMVREGTQAFFETDFGVRFYFVKNML